MARAAKVELHGAADVKRAFANIRSATVREVKDVTRITADEIRKEARARMPVGPGRWGHTRDKFRRWISKDGLSAGVFNKHFIFRFRELGTVKMSAKPSLFPAFEIVRPKYLERLRAAIYGVTRGMR